MSTLTDLARQRAAVDARLRTAVIEAVRSGEPIAKVAREAGVTRPTVYAWTRDTSEDRDRARLAELDERYEALITAIVERDLPAPHITRKGRKRSGLQVEQDQRNAISHKRYAKRETAAESLRRLAETKLASLLADKADKDPTFRAIRDEVDEAWHIRQRLAALEEARVGF